MKIKTILLYIIRIAKTLVTCMTSNMYYRQDGRTICIFLKYITGESVNYCRLFQKHSYNFYLNYISTLYKRSHSWESNRLHQYKTILYKDTCKNIYIRKLVLIRILLKICMSIKYVYSSTINMAKFFNKLWLVYTIIYMQLFFLMN